MNLDRIARLDGSKQIFKIVNAEIGMNTALHKNLCTALCNSLLDLLENFILCQDVGVGTVGLTVERAEFAFVYADIGIVDVPVYYKRNEPSRAKTLSHPICKLSQGQQVSMLE